MPDPPTPSPSVAVVYRGAPPRLAPDPWATDLGDRTWMLARAIATSAGWVGRGRATLVVRSEPEPLIAAVGRFDEADRSWLAAAAAQAAAVAPRVQWLDHAATEAAVTCLAEALEARFGIAALRGFRFAAVPRGGLLVLGTLAYLLGLAHERVGTVADAPTADDEAPLVLVDDVAVSGLRLAQHVRRRLDRRLVVAVLHAHPDLEQAFVERHPRVEAFVAAAPLRDHAPAAMGDDHAAWRDRWRARANEEALWFGQCDHVVYPWNEPDLVVWNPISEREEPGWPLVPPERCLKRRRAPAIDVQRTTPSVGPLRPHPDVIAGDLGDSVVVGHLGTGDSFELEGVAASIWRAVVELGDTDAVARRLAADDVAPPAGLAADVASFVAELRSAGLLTEAPA